ncbi:hypothetical protein PIB30_079035 [Stylosanthes scabra]|uniref:Uncharacterized protein n=1 Tax=Stylosanthes scabra TaxID=79078 RepID=A0ABU6YRT8_9FABA|nr:hypothetical protein [Stylosanthes scabra]
MATLEYFTWWLDACRHRHLSRADALDDPRLNDLPDDIPQTTSQPRDALPPGLAARGGQDEPVQPEPEQPVPEPTSAQHDLAQPEQLDDDFVTGAEDDFAARFGDPEYAPSRQVDPDVGFLATVSGSQIKGIASRYQGIRDARITQQVAPIRPPSTVDSPRPELDSLGDSPFRWVCGGFLESPRTLVRHAALMGVSAYAAGFWEFLDESSA